MVITSPHNETLKLVRKLAGRRDRDRTGLFVAEGEDLVEAARDAGWAPEATLVAAGTDVEGGTEVEPDLLDGVSQLGSGTRVLAVHRQRWADAVPPGRVVHLHGVGDPGNVGTVLRSALAFGATAVTIGPGTADPYSPKAVRASMGAVFAVPLARAAGPGDLPGRRIALVAGAGTPLQALAHDDAVALLVGAERDGLPGDVVSACDETAHVPIASESLNAAMAATVALYELARREAAAGPTPTGDIVADR